MCGIAVAIGWPDADSTVKKLLQGILHRGDVTDPVVSFRKDTAMGSVACASLMRSTRRNRSCLLTGALRLPSTGKFTTAARSPQHPGRDQPKSGFRSVEFEPLISLRGQSVRDPRERHAMAPKRAFA
jgi:hypothetical protein